MKRSVIFPLLRAFLIALLSFVSLSIFAQSTTLTTGADASDSGGSVSYSIGQTIYEATNNEDVNFNGGVQQPYELLFVSTGVIVIEHYSGKMLICDNHEGKFVSYIWYKDGVAVGTDNFYHESIGLNGVYYLEVKDKDGNVYVSKCFFYTSIDVSSKSLSIYPVPATRGEDVHVFLYDENKKSDSETTTIRVYESSGKIVLTKIMDINLPLIVNTSSLLRGTYIVKVGDVSSKIIVR